MDNLILWISSNKEWFLSGLGVTILGALGWIFKKVIGENSSNQQQESGNNSVNIQAKGNINIKNSSIKKD